MKRTEIVTLTEVYTSMPPSTSPEPWTGRPIVVLTAVGHWRHDYGLGTVEKVPRSSQGDNQLPVLAINPRRDVTDELVAMLLRHAPLVWAEITGGRQPVALPEQLYLGTPPARLIGEPWATYQPKQEEALRVQAERRQRQEEAHAERDQARTRVLAIARQLGVQELRNVYGEAMVPWPELETLLLTYGEQRKGEG